MIGRLLLFLAVSTALLFGESAPVLSCCKAPTAAAVAALRGAGCCERMACCLKGEAPRHRTAAVPATATSGLHTSDLLAAVAAVVAAPVCLPASNARRAFTPEGPAGYVCDTRAMTCIRLI